MHQQAIVHTVSHSLRYGCLNYITQEIKIEMKTSKTLIYLAFISFSLLFMYSCSKSSRSSVMPISLTVEYLTNPLGLDIEKPRMSWTLEPTKEIGRASCREREKNSTGTSSVLQRGIRTCS